MNRITIFKNFTKTFGQITLPQIIESTKTGIHKKEIDPIRGAIQKGNKELADQLKKQLLAFTVSGQFEGGRKMKFLKQYNPFVILDIDNVRQEEVESISSKIKSIDYSYAGFVSPSGRGYKVIIKTNATQEQHRKVFDHVAAHYEQVLDLTIDKSGKDITRLCFFSYDPKAFLNQAATVFEMQEDHELATNNLDSISITAKETFDQCVQQMNQKSAYVVGNRNNYLFQLTGICNRAGLSKEIVQAMVTQHFNGIAKSEMKQTIASSYKSYNKNIERDKTSSTIEQTLPDFKSKPPPTIPSKVFRQLPKLLTGCCALFENPYERDVFLTGAIGVLSGCLFSVKGVYDRKQCYPNLFAFVISPAGNGKGSLNYAFELGVHYHEALLEESKIAREQYEQEMEQYEEAKKTRRKPGSEPLKKPILEPNRMLFIPANSSSSMLIHQLKKNGDFGIMFESESDTLGNVLKQDWGGYSDSLRKAAHHERISISRKMNDEFVEIQKPRLSVLLSGTPNQVIKLIPSVEDGLFSRFLFYYFDVQVEWRDVSSNGTGEDFDSYFKRQSAEVKKMIEFLEEHPTKIDLTQSQWNILNTRFRNHLSSTNEAFGTGALSIVKRLGLMLFRIAMIFTAMRKYERKDTTEALFCHNDDFHTALCLIEVYLKHALYIFDRLPQQGSSSFEALTEKMRRFYLKLPQQFSRQEALKVGERLRMKPRTVDRHLRVYFKDFLKQTGKRELYEKKMEK